MQDEGSDHDNRDESEASDEVRVRSSVKLANLPLKTDGKDLADQTRPSRFLFSSL